MNYLVRHLCYECFSTDGSSSDALAYMALYERKICKPVGPISSPGQWKPVIRRTLMISVSAVQICRTQQRGRGDTFGNNAPLLDIGGGWNKDENLSWLEWIHLTLTHICNYCIFNTSAKLPCFFGQSDSHITVWIKVNTRFA